MLEKWSRRLVVAAAVAAFSLGAGAGETGQTEPPGQPMELGREGKALPWLQYLDDAPFVVVKYSDIAGLAGHDRVTPYYEIDEDVVASGYSYFFYVRGLRREYMVGSVINLLKLCRELEVIEGVSELDKGKEVATGLGDSLKSIGTGLGNFVIHPGQSIKSLGTRVRRTGRYLERAVGAEEKVGRAESGEDRSKLGGGPAGAERRNIAYSLGVDVYTSNPEMRDLLVTLSQLRTIGGLGTWFIPYHIGDLSYLNIISGSEVAEQLIRDYSPYELRRLIGERLESIVGMGREDSGQPLYHFLMNPNYSPRGTAYVGLDIETMGSAANLSYLLQVLASADTPEEADMLALQLRLYSFLHQRVRQLGEFVPYQNLFAAVSRDGVFYYMFVGDTLRPWRHTAEAFDAMVREAVDLKARGMEIWCLGDVDPQMVRNAARYGVVVRQNILRDQVYYPAPVRQ